MIDYFRKFTPFSKSEPLAPASTRSRESSVESQLPSSAMLGTPASEVGDIAGRPPEHTTTEPLAVNANTVHPRHGNVAQDATRDLNFLSGEQYHDDEEVSYFDDDEEIEQYEARFYADGHRDAHLRSQRDSSGSESLMLPSISSRAASPMASRGGSPAALGASSTTPQVTSHVTSDPDEDLITDTVGAIAIDSEGNIACGASSGGIGMKFRGRVGPAALVGVGAAVCPSNAEDKSRMCTGAVTSGTGEHMATTLAANVCAERLYNSVRARRGGGLEPCSDDEAVKSMIEQDFMSKSRDCLISTKTMTNSAPDHPSVRNSHSTGAIGVLAVKKMAHGVYLYFAHNTDSFVCILPLLGYLC